MSANTMSIRLADDVRMELEDASWIEDRPATDIIKEGIEMALRPIRAKHGGKIPVRPSRARGDATGATETASETAAKGRAKRRKGG
jgi:hypothetical protein